METAATPFDLDRAIQQWRESLAESPAFRAENLDELESHLRDGISLLKERDCAADEAFLIGRRRMGNGQLLGTEYSKVNSREIWLSRALWMLIGIQLFDLAKSLDQTVCSGTYAFGIKFLASAVDPSDIPFCTGLLGGLIHLLTFALILVAGWRLLTRKGNRISMWCSEAPKSPSRLQALVGGAFVLTMLSGLLRPLVFTFLMHSSSAPMQYALGLSYGTTLASVAESFIMIALTLILARRQLLTGTRA